ncbi:MAG: nucleotidyltransferase domain-containing protein [Planctomycetes bacterium]|nr:nucleotidyltransferase domain-containing protein [Planctomycetota bacterium]
MAHCATLEVDRYVMHQRRLAAAKEQRRKEISAAIRAHLPAVPDELVGLGAKRVIVFGSVARGNAEEDSDLDLAVEGLPSARYFEAMAKAYGAASRPVNLLRLEELGSTLRERVAAEGEVIRDAG